MADVAGCAPHGKSRGQVGGRAWGLVGSFSYEKLLYIKILVKCTVILSIVSCDIMAWILLNCSISTSLCMLLFWA